MNSKKLNIKVIVGSTRKTRFGIQPAQWIFSHAQKVDLFDVEILDLIDYPMPFFDEMESPAFKTAPYKNEIVAKFTSKIAEADAFIIVTPEYNHSMPAVLKNALDYVYQEWNNKPVGFVSYGSVGGARVVDQLKQVAVELQMAPIQKAIHIINFWSLLDETGKLKTESIERQVAPFLVQLHWWAKALKAGRECIVPIDI